jgi:hypothetical protein
MLSGVVGACFLAPLSASAADVPTKAPKPIGPLPAVDGINGKIDAFGGALDGRGIAGVRGAISIPLGIQYGLQVDGAVGRFDNDTFGGAAAHLFWRDPSRALLGIYASYTNWQHFGGLHVSQLAAEGFVYRGQWSFGGVVGVESGNTKSEVVGSFIETYDVKTRFFDKIDLSYYLQPGVKLSIGHRYQGGKHALALGGEVAFASNRGILASAFVEGRIGEDSHRGIWGGLRVYFGQNDKPLVARHRQDDPPIYLPATLFSIVNNFSKAAVPAAPVPPTPPPPDGGS